MTCAVCKGKIVDVRRVYTTVVATGNLIILDVPMQECVLCGNKAHTEKTEHKLKTLAVTYKSTPNLLGNDLFYCIRYIASYPKMVRRR